jgi:hypothetical protein
MDMENAQYPTKPDAYGWFFDSAGDQSLEIETRVDEDENVFKRVRLTKGRVATLRELTGKETKTAGMIGGKDQGKIMHAYIALCAEIVDATGVKVNFVAEDLDGWKGKDLNRLQTAAGQLNF